MSSAVADPWAMSPAARVERLVGLERRVNALHAEQLELMAAMVAADEAAADPLAKHWTVDEIAAALRLAPGTARHRVAVARFAVGQRRLLQLLRAGVVTLMHVVVAERELRHCTAEQTGLVLERELAQAREQTVGEFARALRRGVLSVAADDAARRHEAARAERRVTMRPAADGMADVWAHITAVEAAAIAAGLDGEAHRRLPGDTRTVAQRRADAFVARLLASGTGAAAASGSGLGPQVFVAATTLAGVDEQPGELAGYGPIPAALARRLAADPTGTWRGVLTDNRGQILDYGRRSYRPPAALDRLVRIRDRRCRFPGCTHPARSADLDHIHAWDETGTTTDTNLHVLCRHHHRLKHEGGWRVHRHPDGTTTWRSRTGRVYRVPPTTYPTCTTPIDGGPDPPS